MSNIVIEKISVGDIPAMLFSQEGAINRPTIFYLHGFFGRKEDDLALGFWLASRGFVAVTFDAVHHGERADGALDAQSQLQNCVYPPQSGLDLYLLMHRVVIQNGRDLETLMAHFRHDPRVDSSRYGVTGVSMGGFSSFYAAANNAQVQAAAPIISLPAFAARWDDVVLEAGTYAEWSDQMERVRPQTAEYAAFMRFIDPFERLQHFFPRPLFMLNGDQDTHSPKIYSVQLFRSLQPAYAAHPEQLRLKIYDGAHHEVTQAMVEDVVDWFARHLQP